MRISLGLFLRLLRGLAGVLLGAFPGGEEHVRHAVADAALRLLHHVAVDAGGGGTIAYILANYDVKVIDAGVGVLSMHAPYEVTSKVDIYEAYRGYLTFLMKA